MNIDDYVYISVERPKDHLFKTRIVRFLDVEWFIGETVRGHQGKYAVSRIVRKTYRDAPVWIKESTGEDITYYGP